MLEYTTLRTYLDFLVSPREVVYFSMCANLSEDATRWRVCVFYAHGEKGHQQRLNYVKSGLRSSENISRSVNNQRALLGFLPSVCSSSLSPKICFSNTSIPPIGGTGRLRRRKLGEMMAHDGWLEDGRGTPPKKKKKNLKLSSIGKELIGGLACVNIHKLLIFCGQFPILLSLLIFCRIVISRLREVWFFL